MSERQKDMPKDRLTDRQTEREIEDKTTFQLSYQNKSCSECQQDVRKIERQKHRPTDRQKERQTGRQKDKPSLLISKKCLKVRQTVRQSDQYASMAE